MPFRIIYPLAAITWTAVVFYVCLTPSSGIPTIPWLAHPLTDKAVHVVLYSVLCFLYWRSYMAVKLQPGPRSVFFIAIVCLAIGILIEVLQGTMDLGRSFEIADIFANGIASFTVALIIYYSGLRNKN